MNRNKPKGRQMRPPTPQEIAKHNRALTGLLDAPTASNRATSDDLLLFLDSRGIPRSEYQQFCEALEERPRSGVGRSVCLGGHHARLAITHRGDVTQIQVDGEVIAAIGRKEALNSIPAASQQSSTGASVAI